MKKPVILCILDGWGISNQDSEFNAIAKANLHFYPQILNKYPNSTLKTSGEEVGLPEGQMGNSEVGHFTIGAGRVIFQDLPRINNSIVDSSLEDNKYLQDLIDNFRGSNKTCHLMGLLSDGGVHSHIDHLIFIAELLRSNQVKVALHCFLDGRDVAQKSAIKYLDKVSNFNIATISGRYYAMDRDNKWERIKFAYDAIIDGVNDIKNHKFNNHLDFINQSYQENITDEFIKPAVNINYQGVQNEDSIIFVNFRADRARQLSQALVADNFTFFNRRRINFSHKIAMTEYSAELNQYFKILFPSQSIDNSLGELLQNHGKTQLRIAETEKYAHVSFFFSCGRELEFKGEDRILIPSPKVETYDQKPEMSADELGSKLCEAIKSKKFDFIVVNYANADMVGHSGNLEASIIACKTIDNQLELLTNATLESEGSLVITADHGNIESLQDENQQPHTSHTTNPVPFIIINKEFENSNKIRLKNGGLKDVAPTIIELMNIKKPIEMTGSSLILKNYE
jgi:2,3-bisphosphoglycerate-independent phosphoglycerate mutase